MQGNAQIVFIDTPGIFVAKRRLERAMVQAAWASVDDADVALVIHDAGRSQISAETRQVIEGLAEARCEVVLVLNKVDLVRSEQLPDPPAELSGMGQFSKFYFGKPS